MIIITIIMIIITIFWAHQHKAAGLKIKLSKITIVIIIRLHRSIAHVDAAYCYQPSSVVCQSVCLSH